MTRHGIELDPIAIRIFCRKWKIRELAVFGSVLRDDFRPDSDVDFLFTLEEGTRLNLDSWSRMEEDLQAIIARKVDLVPRDSVEQSENYIRRKHILTTAEPVYAEG